ncbi:MAG: hypothetical protein ACHP65_06980 [Legionellales bacterium]
MSGGAIKDLTSEEKIINMHQKKRDLANELLSGQGVGGKLSNADLMGLILPQDPY